MVNQFLARKIREQLPFTPTDEQQVCIERLADFCASTEQHAVFLLTGYAGTGKTSVVGALVAALRALKQHTVLLAPTGRAAKIFGTYAGQPAYSIHKRIYRQKSASVEFSLNYNAAHDTLFLVDEASMVANTPGDGANFGSGRLLDDLIEFVYTGENCRLVLIGDTAQLPPVMQPFSPALEPRNLEGYGLSVTACSLTEVVRQSAESGILHNATRIRQALEQTLPAISLKTDFPDIHRVDGFDLIEQIQSAYSRSGVENCIIVTRSNRRAVLYNRGIRNQVMCKEDELSSGDLLTITRNNYFWSKNYPEMEFIANGDSAELLRIRGHHEMYGMRFADVTLRFPDYDCEMDVRLLVDSLYTETPAEATQLSKRLLATIEEDYMDIGNRRERYKAMMQNEYLNALQVKFGYAVTCHKAQGGQWSEVFVDQGPIDASQIDADYLRWLYTACTRAQHQLYFVNFADQFFE